MNWRIWRTQRMDFNTISYIPHH